MHSGPLLVLDMATSEFARILVGACCRKEQQMTVPTRIEVIMFVVIQMSQNLNGWIFPTTKNLVCEYQCGVELLKFRTAINDKL